MISEIGESNNFATTSKLLAYAGANSGDIQSGNYIAKKKAQGKHHYVAMAHGMKKMIRVIFRILKNGKDYEEPKK